MLKRILSLLLCLLFLCVGFGCSSEEEKHEYPDDTVATAASDDLFEYNVYDSYVQIVNYKGTNSDVELPSLFEEKPITSINDKAFFNKNTITSVSIPEGVTTVGNNAFSGCTELKSVKFPSSLVSIGNSAFVFCNSLNNIEIPAAVETIGNHAFRECSSLSKVKILSIDIKFGDSVFAFCNPELTITADETSKANDYAVNNGIKFKAIN